MREIQNSISKSNATMLAPKKIEQRKKINRKGNRKRWSCRPRKNECERRTAKIVRKKTEKRIEEGSTEWKTHIFSSLLPFD